MMKRIFLVIVAFGIFGCVKEESSPIIPGKKPPNISVVCEETQWNPSGGSFQVSISYSDEKGLDINSLIVTLNGADVKAKLSIGGEGASGNITEIPACSGVHLAASIKNTGGLSASAYCDLEALKIASPQTQTTISDPLPDFVFFHDSRTDAVSFSVIYDGKDISSRCAGNLTSTTCLLGSYVTPTGTHGFQAERCFSGGGPCCSVSSQFLFTPPVPRVTIRSPKRFNAALSVPLDLFYEDTSRVLGLSSTTATLDGTSITLTLAYTISETVPGFPQSPTSFTATGVSAPLSESSGHILAASATDGIYSQTGSASLSFTVDITNPIINIIEPQNGLSSPPGTGFTYFVSKDFTQPLSITYSDTLSGIDLASIGVSLTGSGTVSFSSGPSGATGNLYLSIPTSAGSDGSGNFIIQASIKDMAGNQAQAGSSITLTLAHLGAGSASVTSGSYFSIPINVYLDPSWPSVLGSYNIQVSYDNTISFVSVSGSDPANPAYASEFAVTPSNIDFPLPQIVSSNSQGSGALSPKGLINIANLGFWASSTGSTTVSLSIVNLCDSTGASIPATRIQSGNVTVN